MKKVLIFLCFGVLLISIFSFVLFSNVKIIEENKLLIPADYKSPKFMSQEQLYQYAEEETEFYDEINYEGTKTYYIKNG